MQTTLSLPLQESQCWPITGGIRVQHQTEKCFVSTGNEGLMVFTLESVSSLAILGQKEVQSECLRILIESLCGDLYFNLMIISSSPLQWGRTGEGNATRGRVRVRLTSLTPPQCVASTRNSTFPTTTQSFRTRMSPTMDTRVSAVSPFDTMDAFSHSLPSSPNPGGCP